MNISQDIKIKLTDKFLPSILQIDDVSYLHANHQEMLNSNSSNQTHFNLLIVSDAFKNISLIARHRLIYTTLHQEIQNGIHALAIKAYTNEEFKNIRTA